MSACLYLPQYTSIVQHACVCVYICMRERARVHMCLGVQQLIQDSGSLVMLIFFVPPRVWTRNTPGSTNDDQKYVLFVSKSVVNYLVLFACYNSRLQLKLKKKLTRICFLFFIERIFKEEEE